MNIYEGVIAFMSILIACGMLMVGHWAWQKIWPPPPPPPPIDDPRDSIRRFHNIHRS